MLLKTPRSIKFCSALIPRLPFFNGRRTEDFTDYGSGVGSRLWEDSTLREHMTFEVNGNFGWVVDQGVQLNRNMLLDGSLLIGTMWHNNDRYIESLGYIDLGKPGAKYFTALATVTDAVCPFSVKRHEYKHLITLKLSLDSGTYHYEFSPTTRTLTDRSHDD